MTESGPSASSIAARAAACGLVVSPEAAEAMAAHARLVLLRNPLLHLTSIVEPSQFLERHLGEAFEGIALLPPVPSGVLLDLGSGNGYPGIPIGVLRPELVPVLAESSKKKAAFLEEALAVAGIARGWVLPRHVERASDLQDLDPPRVIACRAAGGWDRILPKIGKRLAPEGKILIWAGVDLEPILRRAAWKPYALEAVRAIPGRSSAKIALLSATRI